MGKERKRERERDGMGGARRYWTILLDELEVLEEKRIHWKENMMRRVATTRIYE